MYSDTSDTHEHETVDPCFGCWFRGVLEYFRDHECSPCEAIGFLNRAAHKFQLITDKLEADLVSELEKEGEK